MRNRISTVATLAAVLALSGSAGAKAATPAAPGSQEFGLTTRQLVQNIEKVCGSRASSTLPPTS